MILGVRSATGASSPPHGRRPVRGDPGRCCGLEFVIVSLLLSTNFSLSREILALEEVFWRRRVVLGGSAGSKATRRWLYPNRSGLCYPALMPTVLRLGSLRVVIYPNDHRPAHVHVIGQGNSAIFNLNCPAGPLSSRANFGFSDRQYHDIQAKLHDRLAELCTAWEEIHGRA